MGSFNRLLCLLLLLHMGPLIAEPLRVGVSFAIPPYVIAQEGRGIELDLLREAFAGSGYEPQFKYLPLERTFRMLEEGKLDAIINVKPGMLNHAYLSQSVLTFHNRIFTINNPPILRMADLQGLRVSAFQRARQILGNEFTSMADHNPRYEEVARQEGQVQKLLLGRTDAVILEQRVFYYYLAEQIEDEQNAGRYAPAQIRQSELFAPTHYHFAFRQATQQRWFDRQLTRMKQDGRYERIFAAYGATSSAKNIKASP
ncbi:substrate-binding periplasmic protein [Aeromonas tecta]|uniref:substrate-binding periplasmic protein n=1 Tax=Aeromonas tecta TaxID=324617 RepID=UPI000680C48B|nr:transporter substrate-binding domain-containing protein [Aeromonas tecta]